MEEEKSAGGVVFYQNQVLVLRNFRGEYIFPKGHIEGDESIVETAQREVAEEAGIAPVIVAKGPETAYSYRQPNGELRQKRVYWFLMRAESCKVQVDGNEINWGAYLPVAEASQLLTHEKDRMLLQQVLVQLDSAARGE